jgi:Nuclease-related domain
MNIDHIVVAPSGVWVIDTKRYKGKVSVAKPLFGEAKLTVAGRDKSKLADGLDRQVAAVRSAMFGVATDVPVHGALCFVDADLPMLGRRIFRGYPLVYPPALARLIKASGVLPPEQVHQVAAHLSSRFPAA